MQKPRATPAPSDVPHALPGDRLASAFGESERQFHAMIDALPAAIYTTDAEGRLTHFNPAAAEFSGREPELGTDRWCVTWKLFHPDGTPMPHDQCPMAIAIKEGRSLHAELAIAERPDGERIWFDAYPSPLRDSNGRIVGGVNMLIDVTERVRAEQELRKRERELADFFENGPIGMHWVGPDGIIIRANRAELEMLGYTREEYVGRHIAEFHDDEVAIEDILRRLKTGEKLQSYEATLRTSDGSIRHVLIDSDVLWEDGEFKHTRCFTRDITDRKEAEQTRARLSAIVESSDDAIVSKTPEGVITTWNRSAERLFGYTAEEAIGRHISLIIPEDRLHEEAMIIARLRRGERIEHFESVRVRKDGSPVQLSLTISPILNSAGRMVGASKTARNITESKRREQALEAARAEAESARAEAESARDEAQEANQAKSTFLATMSHELRTPLNAIIGFAELLGAEVGGPLNHAQKDHLSRIQASSRHLLEIIEEILTFSRVEAGREEARLENVVLSELVQSTASMVEPLAASNGLEFRVDCSSEGTLRTDPAKVRQILLNLLSNAIKFTEEGEVHLRAAFENGQAVFQVSDTGIGIEEKDRKSIFEAFHQVDQNLSRRAGGTGLGLSVTSHLTDLLNGTTEVESTPGEGSTFTVRLPRRG